MEINALAEAILIRCFEPYEGRFASGESANNKLDLEKIKQVTTLRSEVATRVSRLISRYKPDLIVGVPKGANWLAVDTGRELGVDHLLLHKDDETKDFSFYEADDGVVETASRIVIVDDVLNNLASSGKVYAMPGVAERTVAITGIWDRNPLRTTLFPVPVTAIIGAPIPARLPADSPLWCYAP